MKRALLVIFFFSSLAFIAQNDSVFHLSAKFPDFINQVKSLHGWKYHKGDDVKWADASLDDSKWQGLSSSFNLSKIPENTFENIGWFRIHIEVDTLLVDKTLGLLLTQSGASEIYLDGKFLYSFGKINTKDPTNEEHYSPHDLPVDIRFEKTRKHILAVRYANSRAMSDFKDGNDDSPGFRLRIAKLREASEFNYANSNMITGIFIFYFAFFLAISFLHFMLYLYYKANKSNLYYSIFALTFGLMFIWLLVQQNYLYPDTITTFQVMGAYLPDIYAPALLAMLYNIFNKKIVKIFWLWMAIYVIDFVTKIFNIENEYIYWGGLILFAVETLRIIIASMFKKREGSLIIGAGVITTIVFFTAFTIISALTGEFNYNATGWLSLLFGIITIIATVSIPLSMSIYLARDFAKTSKNLEKKLVEVEDLSAKTIEQEKEKQKILETQKETLEVQVKERTAEISQQKEIIEEKNKDITDSINYAKRIQNAILASKEIKYKIFPDAFVLFRPKDIVSGDFYWFSEKNGKRLIAACDCTGHGVPGALMSMIGNNILNQVVNERGITSPDEVLNMLHKEVKKTLKQDENTDTKDGMDVALLSFTSETEIEYAGAQRPVWIIRGKALEEIKAIKISIGGQNYGEEVQFVKHSLSLSKGDTVYIFSDGYADQFNTLDKKLLTKKFKEILQSIQHLAMPEQEKYLNDFIEKWKGNLEQTDDILVIGIKI
jgi:serine phosphatase RsbU (regulator of sigma subunit)